MVHAGWDPCPRTRRRAPPSPRRAGCRDPAPPSSWEADPRPARPPPAWRSRPGGRAARSGASADGLETGEDDGDVVCSSGGVGGADELLAGAVEVVLVGDDVAD